MSQGKCKDCRWWERGDRCTAMRAMPEGMGECRIRSRDRFPVRRDEDWCGEFYAEKEEGSEAGAPATSPLARRDTCPMTNSPCDRGCQDVTGRSECSRATASFGGFTLPPVPSTARAADPRLSRCWCGGAVKGQRCQSNDTHSPHGDYGDLNGVAPPAEPSGAPGELPDPLVAQLHGEIIHCSICNTELSARAAEIEDTQCPECWHKTMGESPGPRDLAGPKSRAEAEARLVELGYERDDEGRCWLHEDGRSIGYDWVAQEPARSCHYAQQPLAKWDESPEWRDGERLRP